MNDLAGWLRANLDGPHVRRAENVALNYLATQRAGTPLEAVIPVVPEFPVDELLDHDIARAVNAWKKHGPGEKFTAKIESITHGAVMSRGRSVIRYNAAKAGVRVARVPEAGACFFCLMLASRGPAYTSTAAALYGRDGDKYHDHCRCSVVEARVNNDGVEEYPAKVQACMDFKENIGGINSVESWREAVESGAFTRATGLTSVTRDIARNSGK